MKFILIKIIVEITTKFKSVNIKQAMNIFYFICKVFNEFVDLHPI